MVGKENAPGIVVLQEWWGVDFEIKNHAIHISQLGQGYRALIPEYVLHFCSVLIFILVIFLIATFVLCPFITCYDILSKFY